MDLLWQQAPVDGTGAHGKRNRCTAETLRRGGAVRAMSTGDYIDCCDRLPCDVASSLFRNKLPEMGRPCDR